MTAVHIAGMLAGDEPPVSPDFLRDAQVLDPVRTPGAPYSQGGGIYEFWIRTADRRWITVSVRMLDAQLVPLAEHLR